MVKFIVLISFILPYINFLIALELIPQYEWNTIEFDWDDEIDLGEETGEYIENAVLPVDVDQYVNPKNASQKSITFVTLLRKAGVPATLTTITEKEGKSGPLLRPYPNWSYMKDCSGLTNVLRIAITKCGQLWALDSGTIDEKQVCPPKITVFDLDTDQVIQELKIPQEVAGKKLINIVVQPLDDECSSSAAYLADGYGNALIIYDGTKFCRLESPEFGPEPGADTFKIGNDTLQISVGVIGLSITPPNKNNAVIDQDLYFNALSAYSMYYVNTGALLDYCTSGIKPQINKEGNPLSSQSVVQVIDGNGRLYYSSISDTSLNFVNVWNDTDNKRRVLYNRHGRTLTSRSPHCTPLYGFLTQVNSGTKSQGLREVPLAHACFTLVVNSAQVILSENPETLQWISGLKVVPPQSSSGTILVLSNRYQKFHSGTLDPNDVNYRILALSLRSAT